MTEDVRMVFYPTLWRGTDAGDNSQFWKPASIVAVSRVGPYGDEIATVRFHHDGRESAGHFTAMMRVCHGLR